MTTKKSSMITEQQFNEARDRVRRDFDNKLEIFIPLTIISFVGMVLAIALIYAYHARTDWMPKLDRWAFEHPLIMATITTIGTIWILIKMAKR